MVSRAGRDSVFTGTGSVWRMRLSWRQMVGTPAPQGMDFVPLSCALKKWLKRYVLCSVYFTTI